MVDSKLPVVDPRWGQLGRDRKAEVILATLRLHAGRSVSDGVWLDVGCGSGGIAATLAGHVAHMMGLDPGPWVRWDAFRGQHSNLVFHVGSYRNLPEVLGASSVDVVVCNQVYEHVDDPLALLDAIRVALKPGGICYFAGPNLLWPIEPHVFWPFVHWLPRGFAKACMRRLGLAHADELDAWSWSWAKLLVALQHAGFHIRNALSGRLLAGVEFGGSRVARLLSWMPAWFVGMLTPISPSSVFLLTKPAISGRGS